MNDGTQGTKMRKSQWLAVLGFLAWLGSSGAVAQGTLPPTQGVAEWCWNAGTSAWAPCGTFAPVAPSGTSDVNLVKVGGVTYALGSALSAASMPVVIASDQVAIAIKGAVSNATSGVATTSTNVPSIAYNYGFNGTTWDQLQVDASKFLKVGAYGTYNATVPTLTDGLTSGTQMGVNGAIITQPQDAIGASFQSLTATTATTLVTLSPAQTAGYSKLELNYIAASGGSAIIVETSWDNFVTAAVTMTGMTSGNNGSPTTSFVFTTAASFRLSGPYVRIRTTSVTSGTATVQFALRSGGVLDNISATLTANGGSPTIVSQGKTASGATANENPLYDGGRAENAEATAVTNGQKVGAAYDLVGRAISFPFANKENLVTRTVALTDTTSTSFIASAGGALFNYLTGISCTNAGTAGVTVTLKNGDGGTTVWQAYVAPNGGGIVDNPPTPITGIQNMTAATAIFIVLGGSPSGTVYCNGRGFKGT